MNCEMSAALVLVARPRSDPGADGDRADAGNALRDHALARRKLAQLMPSHGLGIVTPLALATDPVALHAWFKLTSHGADISRMAAAPPTVVVVKPAVVSPELVLVDPALAAPMRALLPDTESQSRSDQPPTPRTSTRVPVRDRGPFGNETAAASEARRRLMDGAVVSEALGSVASPGNRLRRRATLIPSTSAATSVGFFVLQLYLAQGHLG